MGRWLKRKSPSSFREKNPPEQERTSANGGAGDVSVNVNNINPQDPRASSGNVTKVKQQSEDKFQANWLRM